MFIRKDGSLKLKWILMAAVLTAVLVLSGVFWTDLFLYSIIHNPECNSLSLSSGFFCSVFSFIENVFNAKVWLAASFLSVLFVFVYKAIFFNNDFRYSFVKLKNSYAFYIFSSVLSASVIVGILKIIIGRARPVFYDSLGKVMFVPWTLDDIFHSMPSGHTAVSFAGLVMIGMLYPKIKAFTWAFATFIGFSRVYMGAHFPSDVIFGAFIGMVMADFVKYSLKKINNK